MSKLVIVESPAKAKTIKKYLGSGYNVMASNGHVRDLPKSKIGVDIENGFKPSYINIREKAKTQLIDKLKKEAAKSDKVFLATDPDREGEAISWHLAHILKLDLNDNNRVTFNEITSTGIKAGMEGLRSIDINLVDAQQARRILDRIVGYKISPFLWRKIRKGLSAGRVQSVAVRIIVDREEEITAFNPEEYWSIDALCTGNNSKKSFDAKFHGIKGKKTEINDEKMAQEIFDKVKAAPFVIEKIKKSVRKKSSAPPFITSTLQQEASRKLNFQSRRTMQAAQTLYEGVEIEGMGAIGLITYMRTDSLRISEEARAQATEFITTTYGGKYLPENPKYYKSRSSAQDAHEAIRPTLVSLTPEKIKSAVTVDQYKLYKLIWERFLASLMSDALLDTVSIDILAADCNFKASGFTVKFDGFTTIYEEGQDEDQESAKSLPKLEEGEILNLLEINKNQHFTQPPARYTEASLIKLMEEKGIGRPSTYSSVITTIVSKEYIERDGKTLKPTTLGEVITKLMKEQFSNIVDLKFTASMEEKLDLVEEGKNDWVKTLEDFYGDFAKTLENAEKNMEGTKVIIPVEETDVLCEKCGKNMVIKTGRFGKFLACPGFPDCKNAKPITKDSKGLCPLCGGKVLAKKTKKNKLYFGCEHHLKCEFMTWETPLDTVCPKCNTTLFQKAGKTGKIHCLKEGCDYEQDATE